MDGITGRRMRRRGRRGGIGKKNKQGGTLNGRENLEGKNEKIAQSGRR